MEKKYLEWNTIEKEEVSSPQLKKKKPWRDKIFFIPLGLALISTFIQFVFLKSCNYISTESNSSQKYAVIVALKKIHQGDYLSTENTRLSYLDLGESKSNFVLNSEFQKFLGHKIKMDIDEKTPILKSIVLNGGKPSSLLENIPHGKRFYVMDVDLSSLSTLIKVGDRIDIIAHMDIDGFGKATETILNGIKIIGIGDNFEEYTSQPDANTLSFYLTPEEIKIISFMKSYSQFSIMLRNPNDLDLSDNESITFNKFLQNDKIQKILQNDSFKIVEGKTIIKRQN